MKIIKRKIMITLVLIAVFMSAIAIFYPKIIEREYATIGEKEDVLQVSKENITQYEENEDKQKEEKEIKDNIEKETPQGQENSVEVEEELEVEEKTKEESKDKPTEKNKTMETMKIINDILLVNKTFDLPADYNPGENDEAVSFLKKMIKGAREEIGRDIMSVSGYRSYDYQKGLYDKYVKKDGEKVASTYSAKPGQSEHQTGLAFDIGGVDKQHWVKESFADTKEGKWLKENAHRYGYILRYPKGKTAITGYKYEPWHFRYIGIEHATNVYERDITLEEYLLK